MVNQDTICAIATAHGGAIGLIRISGPSAISVTQQIFSPLYSGKKLSEQSSYSLTFGHIYKNQELIDEVLVSLFRQPNSYTGENVVEISCHGSSYILQETIQMLLNRGCRYALPGEFTQRAFLNGKLDLSQAEAVAELISSSSAATHRVAMNQMRGGFSKELTRLRTQLLNFTSMIELELDFGEEDVEFANRDELLVLANTIEETISQLANSFSLGNAIKNGIPVAIIGETNAGKSTLLNTLLNEDKAIVSDIHGTTRDVIEDTVNIQGKTFRFIDTAGIRETTDTIESLGIERTFQKINQAEVVLWVIDTLSARQEFERLYEQILPLCTDKKIIIIFNKSDLITEAEQDQLVALPESIQANYLFISAKFKQNISELETMLTSSFVIPEIDQNQVIVTNMRHFEALTNALEAIHRVQEGLKSNISGDFLAQDIRECIFFLSDIVGEVTTDEVLGNIFKNFCIGK